MCVGSSAGVTYLRNTVLTRSKKAETAVHCCDPALSVLVVLVSRNVFHVVSALQSICFMENRNAPDSPDFSPFIQDDRTYLRFGVFISRQNLGRWGNSKIPDRVGFSRHSHN